MCICRIERGSPGAPGARASCPLVQLAFMPFRVFSLFSVFRRIRTGDHKGSSLPPVLMLLLLGVFALLFGSARKDSPHAIHHSVSLGTSFLLRLAPAIEYASGAFERKLSLFV